MGTTDNCASSLQNGSEYPMVSIVIATFNSAQLLPIILGAVRKQTYPQDRIEILAVDGGSTDHTKAIARELGCIVLDNDKTEPVNGKYIGFQAARGKYLVYLDHDEELQNPDAIRQMVEVFRRYPAVRLVDSSGYITPPNYSVVNDYINEFGDPFSFFMYRQSRGMGFHLPAVMRRGEVEADDEYATVFRASPKNKALFIENLASGMMTDLEYVREKIPIQRGPDLCHLFFLLNDKGASFAVAKNNPLMHYSGDTFAKLLAKIRWRVKNNIHQTDAVGAAGFHGRQQYQPVSFRYRKYLFIPYAFTLIPLLVDAILLTATRRKLLYFSHVFLTLYTAVQILHQMALRLVGMKPAMRSYDEKSVINKE